MSTYFYSSGDLLKQRNTYFYSKFEGAPFLDAWKKARGELTAEPAEFLPLMRRNVSGQSKNDEIQTADLLVELLQELDSDQQRLKRFVQRFEVNKRIYESYKKTDFRASDKTKYQQLSNYIDAATLFALAYQGTQDLVYLNVLLKIMDTLHSQKSVLDDQQLSFLVRLSNLEEEYVRDLAARKRALWPV